MRDEARTAHIINPILDTLNKFIQSLRHEIQQIGQKTLLDFDKYSKMAQKRVDPMKHRKMNTGGKEQDNLDTIKEVFKNDEGQSLDSLADY